MATINSNGTGGGLWSNTASWSGGVVPIEGDRVIIATTDTVEINGTYTSGDGTFATTSTVAIYVQGTLKASRTVSSDFTCKGTIGVAANGILDWGTTASPIPNGVTSILRLAKSATTRQVGINQIALANTGQSMSWYFQGKNTRVRKCHLASSVSAGVATITLTTSSHGWEAGDTVWLVSNDGSINREDKIILSTIGANITFTTNLAYPHGAGYPAGNKTSNVKLMSYESTGTNFCYLTNSTPQISGADTGHENVLFTDVEIYNMGYATNQPFLNTICKGHHSDTRYEFTNISFHSNAASTQSFVYRNNYIPIYITGSIIDVYDIQGLNDTYVKVLNCMCQRSGTAGFSLSTYDNTWFIGYAHNPGVLGSAGTYTNCVASGRVIGTVALTPYSSIFEDCDIGGNYTLVNQIAGDYLFRLGGFRNQACNISLINCSLNTNSETPETDNELVYQVSLKVLYKYVNGDLTYIKYYTERGIYTRENTEIRNGTSSLKMIPYAYSININRAVEKEIEIFIANGETITVVGAIKMSSAFYNGGTCNYPTVTISGLGLTPSVHTATVSANNTWEKYVLTITNTSGLAGFLTITQSISAQTTSTGSVYFDGLPDSPWIEYVRHYGYLFETGTVTRTVNSVITESDESIVAAYTGITITHGATDRIDITSTHTLAEVYDYSQYNLVQSTNLLETDPYSSSTGTQFNLAYDLKLNGGNLNGLWPVTIASGKKLIVSNTETFATTVTGQVQYLTAGITASPKVSSGSIDFNAIGNYNLVGATITGTVILTNSSAGAVTVTLPYGTSYTNTGPSITITLQKTVSITAASLIDGTRVQIYNIDDSVEIDNSVVSGGLGYTYSYTYTADKTIRLRACYQNGTTAKLPIVTTGALTSNGASFLDTQEDDDFYIAIGVDGSLVDSSNGGEITADFTNIQIDVNDSDNTFDARRGISWWRYITQTSTGISTYNPLALTYNPDEYNILIDGALQIENTKSSALTITNGVWKRSDNATIIASTSNTVYWVPNDRVYTATDIRNDVDGALKLTEFIALK